MESLGVARFRLHLGPKNGRVVLVLRRFAWPNSLSLGGQIAELAHRASQGAGGGRLTAQGRPSSAESWAERFRWALLWTLVGAELDMANGLAAATATVASRMGVRLPSEEREQNRN